MPFHACENSIFAHLWVGYTLSFERVLAQWEAGNFDKIRPASAMPLGGIMAVVVWSRKRGEAKQRELVGMTAVVS